jgi:hypothetical protein
VYILRFLFSVKYLLLIHFKKSFIFFSILTKQKCPVNYLPNNYTYQAYTMSPIYMIIFSKFSHVLQMLINKKYILHIMIISQKLTI